MTSRPEDFGETINSSRWFNREPLVRTSRVRPIGYHWDCPMDGCNGEMRYIGQDWPPPQLKDKTGRPVGSQSPGFHHACDKCGFIAAIQGRKFPYVDHEEIPE